MTLSPKEALSGNVFSRVLQERLSFIKLFCLSSSSFSFLDLCWKYGLLTMTFLFSALILPSIASVAALHCCSFCSVWQGLWIECLGCCNKVCSGVLFSSMSFKSWTLMKWGFNYSVILRLMEREELFISLPWLGDSRSSVEKPLST